VGISSEDLKQLFRSDVHHSTLGTTKEKGTGFGLLLCKEFVEKNGGQISIQSQLGQGTSIVFTLPLVAVTHMENK
jgi:signal transduction histidine kinase